MGVDITFNLRWVNSSDEWTECGAFCIALYDDEGEEKIVIVDDHLPFDGGDMSVFHRAEPGGKLYPSMIEKAFAKLYGSYDAIAGGHADKAFAHLTD